MVVVWSAVAEKRLKEIFDWYLAVAGRKVAVKIATKIREAADSLAAMPLKAPVEKELEGRTFIYRSLLASRMFKVIYLIDEKAECILIVTVYDCRRNPAGLQDEISK